ncbi:hypothetical protein BCVP_CDS0154 [Bacillus phage BC-VP]|nr:hypothetical protein BCVP_CDS0154 [Bacillus phage BC-VP]
MTQTNFRYFFGSFFFRTGNFLHVYPYHLVKYYKVLKTHTQNKGSVTKYDYK